MQKDFSQNRKTSASLLWGQRERKNRFVWSRSNNANWIHGTYILISSLLPILTHSRSVLVHNRSRIIDDSFSSWLLMLNTLGNKAFGVGMVWHRGTSIGWTEDFYMILFSKNYHRFWNFLIGQAFNLCFEQISKLLKISRNNRNRTLYSLKDMKISKPFMRKPVTSTHLNRRLQVLQIEITLYTITITTHIWHTSNSPRMHKKVTMRYAYFSKSSSQFAQ